MFLSLSFCLPSPISKNKIKSFKKKKKKNNSILKNVMRIALFYIFACFLSVWALRERSWALTPAFAFDSTRGPEKTVLGALSARTQRQIAHAGHSPRDAGAPRVSHTPGARPA